LRVPPPLVLASTSRFRRALLDRLGLPYEARAPNFEEIAPEGLSPAAIARSFAESKARSTQADPAQWIIALHVDLHGVPRLAGGTGGEGEGAAQLAELAGHPRFLHSAVALFSPATGAVLAETVTVELHMRALSAELIERYVALDQPIGSAGGFFFENRGVALFDEVRGGDESAIVGLPLGALCRLLRVAGLEPLSLML